MHTILKIAMVLVLVAGSALYVRPREGGKPVPGPLLELRDGDRIVYYGNTLLERDRHFGMIETMFRARCPGRKISFRNLAWPGDTVQVQLRPLNFGSMEQHLRTQRPSIILVSFGNNEAYDGEAGLRTYIEHYRRQLNMLKRIGAKTVLLSPIRHENFGPPFPNPSAYNEKVRQYADATRQLAQEAGAIYVDLYKTLISAESDPPVALTDNSVHLNQYGYWRLSEILADQLGLPRRWEVILDRSKEQLVRAEGTQLQQLQWKPDALSFQASDTVLPNPAPEGAPEDADVHAAQRRIQILGLSDGTYELLFDGKPIVRAAAKQWEQGIVLTNDPSYEQVRKLRRKVIEKDLLFFYRWRAHNGEYIYGRRSKPGGGNAGNPTFPVEFVELDRLLSQSDQHLDQLAMPQTHIYTFRRVQP